MQRLITVISIFIALSLLILSCSEKHNIHKEEVEYRAGDVVLKGYLAFDKRHSGKRPGIIVVHEWWGHNDRIRKNAEKLAELGYTAFAIDMFGDGKQANNTEEAAKLAREISENPRIRHSRFSAALDILKQHETVDPDSIAAIGYSFGGNVVLKMAFDGADLDAVVSFHGGLLVNKPADPSAVKASILILNGEKDWYITPQMISRFKTNMKNSGINYTIINYKGAEHGYSNPEADALSEKFKGMRIKYNKEADKKSWNDMKLFLNKVFHKYQQ